MDEMLKDARNIPSVSQLKGIFWLIPWFESIWDGVSNPILRRRKSPRLESSKSLCEDLDGPTNQKQSNNRSKPLIYRVFIFCCSDVEGALWPYDLGILTNWPTTISDQHIISFHLVKWWIINTFYTNLKDSTWTSNK